MGWALLEQARPPCTPPPSWAQHRCPVQPLSAITRESHFMVKEHFSVCSPPGPEKSAEWVQILSHYKYSSYVLHFTACNFLFLPTALSCTFTLQVWLGVTSRAIDGILFPQWTLQNLVIYFFFLKFTIEYFAEMTINDAEQCDLHVPQATFE